LNCNRYESINEGLSLGLAEEPNEAVGGKGVAFHFDPVQMHGGVHGAEVE
jgi:hypothetical protein